MTKPIAPKNLTGIEKIAFENHKGLKKNFDPGKTGK